MPQIRDMDMWFQQHCATTHTAKESIPTSQNSFPKSIDFTFR